MPVFSTILYSLLGKSVLARKLNSEYTVGYSTFCTSRSSETEYPVTLDFYLERRTFILSDSGAKGSTLVVL